MHGHATAGQNYTVHSMQSNPIGYIRLDALTVQVGASQCVSVRLNGTCLQVSSLSGVTNNVRWYPVMYTARASSIRSNSSYRCQTFLPRGVSTIWARHITYCSVYLDFQWSKGHFRCLAYHSPTLYHTKVLHLVMLQKREEKVTALSGSRSGERHSVRLSYTIDERGQCSPPMQCLCSYRDIVETVQLTSQQSCGLACGQPAATKVYVRIRLLRLSNVV